MTVSQNRRLTVKYALLGAALGLGLAGCATAPIYQPVNGSSFGYSDQKIEETRYQVSYNGSTSTPRATVENFLLYRMAEITLDTEHDYFRVLDSDTECHTKYVGTNDGQPCTYHRNYGTRFPYYGYGYYCDPFTSVYESKRYEAIAYMSVHKGDKPADDPYAFDARAVSSNLAAQINRGP
jgi:hypothetical protein